MQLEQTIRTGQDPEFYIYDQVMLGRKKTLGKELFSSTVNNAKQITEQDEERVLKVIRYALEYYMGWEPEQTKANLDPKVLKRLRLEGVVNQRIRFPVELEPMQNMDYLVHRLYPDRYHYSQEDAVIAYYEKVLNGEVERFKKDFFKDGDGRNRAIICFKRMLQTGRQFRSYKEMFDFFATTAGRQMISHAKLGSPCRDLFQYPIVYLYAALPPEVQEEYEDYYNYLKFGQINAKQKLELKKQGKFIA